MVSEIADLKYTFLLFFTQLWLCCLVIALLIQKHLYWLFLQKQVLLGFQGNNSVSSIPQYISAEGSAAFWIWFVLYGGFFVVVGWLLFVGWCVCFVGLGLVCVGFFVIDCLFPCCCLWVFVYVLLLCYMARKIRTSLSFREKTEAGSKRHNAIQFPLPGRSSGLNLHLLFSSRRHPCIITGRISHCLSRCLYLLFETKSPNNQQIDKLNSSPLGTKIAYVVYKNSKINVATILLHKRGKKLIITFWK